MTFPCILVAFFKIVVSCVIYVLYVMLLKTIWEGDRLHFKFIHTLTHTICTLRQYSFWFFVFVSICQLFFYHFRGSRLWEVGCEWKKKALQLDEKISTNIFCISNSCNVVLDVQSIFSCIKRIIENI